MICKAFVDFGIAFNDLLLSFFCANDHFFFAVIFVIKPIYDKEVGFMIDILTRDRIKITLAKRKVVNGVEYIDFSQPICSDKAVDFGVKIEGFSDEVFVINKG